nr:hypothetical protein [Tanacetum cinerariifolium]
ETYINPCTVLWRLIKPVSKVVEEFVFHLHRIIYPRTIYHNTPNTPLVTVDTKVRAAWLTRRGCRMDLQVVPCIK